MSGSRALALMWQVGVPTASLSLALAAGATVPVALTMAALMAAITLDAGSLMVRALSGATLLACGFIAWRFDGASPAAVELARTMAAAALLVGTARVADVLLRHVGRTGYWRGAVGVGLANVAVAIIVAAALVRGWHTDTLVLAVLCAAGAARLIQQAAAEGGRASTGAWVSAGVGLAAAAGLITGSVDLPRLGTDCAAVPVVPILVLLCGARALHELSLPRMASAARYGIAAALLAAGGIVAGLLYPELLPPIEIRTLAGRSVSVGPAVVAAAPILGVQLAVAVLMLLTIAVSARRFGWMVGWLCGLSLLMIGMLGVTGWFVGLDTRLMAGSPPVTVMGSVAMVAAAIGIIQIASGELRLQRFRTIWMPALAAASILVATMFGWQQAQSQVGALRRESAMLALERASRAVREGLAGRIEDLSRIARAVRAEAPAGRAERLVSEADLYLRDTPGAVAVLLVTPRLTVREAFVAERGRPVIAGEDVAIDARRRETYRQVGETNRPALLGPLQMVDNGGTGFLAIVPLDLDGERNFLVASNRYAQFLQAALEPVVAGFDVDVATGGETVLRYRASAGPRREAAEFADDVVVLRSVLHVALRQAPGIRVANQSLPPLILGAGLALAILVAVALRQAALASERADEAERSRITAERASAAQLAVQSALAESQAEAARVLDSMSDLVFTLDRELRFTFLNARAQALLEKGLGPAIGCALAERFPSAPGSDLEAACRAALAGQDARPFSGYSSVLGLWFAGRAHASGAGLTVLVQDVTESRRAELFEREQREVLEAIAIGEALDDTLTRVVRLFEYLHPGATCAVMLFDPSSGCMRPGPAPGLPAAYCAALDGVPIGVTAGSCGTAMFFGERVVTVDTANDPLWADFRHLAQAYGLVACWSQPFMSRSGTPLGSLAVYQQERREPNAREIAALETLAAICAIAVERAQSQRQIEESEQRFRSLFDNQPDAVYSLDRDGCITSINEAVVALSGMPREAILGRHYESLIDIDSAEEVRGYFRRALAGTAQRYATVGVRADGSRRQLDVTNLPIVVDGVITGLFGVARDVTEQRAIEARLLERDRFFSLSPLVFTISGHGPCFSQVNDALPRLLGFSREQLLQRPIAEFIIADDLPSTRAAVGGLAADSNLTAFINRYRCADGGIRWLEWNALRADDGTIFATARDVTEQTLSAQSEALMRRVLESSPAVLWRWLPQWGWPAEFVTENVAQWGYAPADFTSRRVNYADLLHPSDAAAYVAAMEESDRSGADSFEFVYRLRTADGRWAWVDERTAIVRHPDGSVNYWQGVTLDVSVREEAREALLQRDRFFELSPDLFAIITGEGHYLQVNRAFTTLLGHGAEALLGRPYTDFVHPDDLDAARADRLGLDASARIDAVALRQLCRDGSTRLVLWNALRMPDGGILVSGRDVTEERRAQEQERLLTRIIEGSPAVMWRWGIGPGAAVSLVSENVRQWGYEPDDFLSGRLDFVRLVHPDDVDAAMACMAQAALPGIDHYRGTYRVRKADGSWIWVDERTTIMRDADGVAQYLQGITLDVTDAQRAREDERQLVVAIETGPAVLWRFDPHAAPTTLSVTANVARWGYAPDDFTSGRLRFVDLLHPDDYDEVVVGSLRRIEAGANELMREYRMRTADGRWVWIDEYLQVIRDRDRRRVLCLSLALDTTETRMAREQERQLRQVIELSPAVLWRFDLSRAVPTSLVSSNVSQWGYVPEDFTSGRLLFDDLIHPDDHARVVQVTRSAIAGGAREVQVDFRFRTADGRWVWLDERVTMVRDRDGTLVDSVSLTLDVTAQRDALAAVHERDQFYALSLEVFAVVDSRGCFRQASEALVRVLGYPLEAIIGHPLLEFVHADDLARTQAHMRTLADGGRIDSVELRCRHAGGGWRWLEWNAAAGPAGLYYCAARDVTDHKRVSAELRRALLDLELRNVELQDFAFVASHDLQEPLRKVQAFTDRVIARYADRLDAQGVDYLRRMDAAAGRMQTLIDDLLAYSRVSTRGESFRAVDLGRVLDEVQADLEARLESSGGQIVSGALPLIEADPTQMRQLLQNLLGNALKFAVPGRRPLVEVSAERVELVVPGAESRSGWRLTVSDNGIGFDNAQAERIFVPFQRLHGRSEYEGTGMGLAIVRKIVERHGGTIRACAQPGQGAKFMVELPASQLKPVRNGGQQPAIMASGGID